MIPLSQNRRDFAYCALSPSLFLGINLLSSPLHFIICSASSLADGWLLFLSLDGDMSNNKGLETNVAKPKDLEVARAFVSGDETTMGAAQDTNKETMMTASGAVKPVADVMSLFKGDGQGYVLGDFSINKKLGQGGMGAVFKAKQISLDREVALKVLSQQLAGNDTFVARFYREAKVMARLAHPNIIQCFAVGESNGLHYLAMEFVDGCSLQNLIDDHAKEGKFPLADAVQITIDVARALQQAHDQKIVHRDVKPDNVLITKKGVVKLADLGLAKPEDDDLGLTASGVGAGTPHYMPPEQMRSAKNADNRADIYALGVMLYVMLTGQRPFNADTLVDLVKQKEAGTYKGPRQLRKDIPDRLDLILGKMMEKSLTARYQSCNEVIDDLEKLGLAKGYLATLFPDGANSAVRTVSRVSGNSQARPSHPAATAPPVSARPMGTGAITEETWYVTSGTTADGKRKVKKYTTTQLMEQIKTKQIDSTAEASKQPATGYKALATYQEFDITFRSLIVQKKVEKKSEKIQSKFDQIAREVESYESRKGWSRFFHSLGNRMAILIVLGLLIAVGVAAWLFGPALFKMIAGRVGVGQ